MANPLTGDFDAVLQVSGGTVNRLMATMHQNRDAKPSLPTFPHSVGLRLGDDLEIDGVRGTMWAQVSVPTIELIHGVDDRFRLELAVRARYVPDAGTEPLAEFIDGVVHAEYRLEDIDPNCLGWRKDASEFLWFRVVDDSVSFHGTAANDESFLAVSATVDEQDVIDKVTRQLRLLLKTRFAPMPHRVSKRFRRGSMRTLNVGIGHSAVAIPLEGGGQLASVDQVVLDGHDLAVAISADYILSKIQPTLDDLKDNFFEQIHFHSVTSTDLGFLGGIDWLTVDFYYTVTLTSAWAEWTGGSAFGMNAGLITVHISGQAVTGKSGYNITFDVTQHLVVSFDASVEGLSLSAGGTPAVDIHYGGPFAGEVKANAKPKIQSQVAAQVQSLVNQAGQFSFAGRKTELIDQLRTIDDQADAYFEDAQFSPDGVALLGTIPLAPRRRPLAKFEKTPERDGYSAYLSWIPGGRIEKFQWSWSWSGNAHPAGSETADDRFLLRRPPGGYSKFGYAIGLTTPLPGLDGWGTVCLNVVGKRVDTVSGELVPAESGRKCVKYDWNVRVIGASEAGRLLLRDGDQGLLLVGGRESAEPAANTLIVYADDSFGEDTGAALRHGLAACERNDAGLVVLVLFREGALGTAERELRELAGSLEAPMLVNEDVRGGWSASLALADEVPAWRLVSPTGAVTWMHDGRIGAEELGRALDGYLFPSGPGFAQPYQPGLDRMSPIDLVGLIDTHCPPPPLGRLSAHDKAVVFVQADSDASDAKLRQLVREHEAGGVVAVVDGASAEEAQALGEKLGDSVVVIPDSGGRVSDRFGIRYWPTTLTVNDEGMVVGHDVGAPARDTAGERGA